MIRLVISLLIGLVLGAGIGLYAGWVQFPVAYVNSPMTDLSQRFKDDYTVMIAAGYTADGDLEGAVERLRRIGVTNIPDFVQDTAERYITSSGEVDDVRALVAFAEGLGRLTPIMEPYRLVNAPGAGQ
jgi:hypothetical protein